jgi:predicted DNA-binding protein
MYRNEFNFKVAKEGNAKLIERLNTLSDGIDWVKAAELKEAIDNEIQIAEVA